MYLYKTRIHSLLFVLLSLHNMQVYERTHLNSLGAFSPLAGGRLISRINFNEFCGDNYAADASEGLKSLGIEKLRPLAIIKRSPRRGTLPFCFRLMRCGEKDRGQEKNTAAILFARQNE